MKIILAIFVVLVMAPCMLWSQSELRLGLTASPQISWMQSNREGVDPEGAYLGYSYGLWVDWAFAENYAVATGLHFSQVGGTMAYDYPVMFNSVGDQVLLPPTEVSYRNQFMQIPATMKLLTDDWNRLRFYGQLGVLTELCVRSRADMTNSALNLLKENFAKDISLIHLGLTIGAGIEYPLRPFSAIATGLMFSRGVTNISKMPKDFRTNHKQSYVRLVLGAYF